MPLVPPLVEMLWNVRPPAAIDVFVTVRAAPVVGVPAPIVFVPVVASEALLPAKLLDVNVGLAPFSVTPPEKANEPAVLLFRVIPVPLSVTEPLNVTAPPLRPEMSMTRPALLLR